MSDERILVVDDQPMVTQVCAAILAEAGCRVRAACGGRGALAWLDAERFDLLLADLKMPEVDALTLCSRARAPQSMPASPSPGATGGVIAGGIGMSPRGQTLEQEATSDPGTGST